MPKKYFSVSYFIFILFGVVIEVGTKYFFYSDVFAGKWDFIDAVVEIKLYI